MSVLTSKIIYAAYRNAGILKGPQRGLSTEETQEGLECFNTIIDVWNSQRYLVLSIAPVTFNLVAGQQVYSIGPTAADWVTPRPPKIEDASLISLQNPAQPLEIPLQVLTYDQWQLVCLKSTTSTYPQAIWYNAAQSLLPNAAVSVWPVPTLNYQIALYAWSQIAQAVAASTALNLAPGYQITLEHELAIALCPRWRVSVPPDIRIAAIEYKKNIKSVNAPDLDLRCDEALLGNQRGSFNYKTGGFGRGFGY